MGKNQADQVKQKLQQESYQQMIKAIKPKQPILRNAIGAFLVGGLICLIAQVINNIFIN